MQHFINTNHGELEQVRHEAYGYFCIFNLIFISAIIYKTPVEQAKKH